MRRSLLVEVPGIEPGSDDIDWRLLRAQPLSMRSRLPCSSWPVRERSPVTVTVPQIPVTGIWQLAVFTTPEIRSYGNYGPTDFMLCARSDGEGEVSALVVGTYWFRGRIMRSPRLLSPLLSSRRSTSKPVTPLFSYDVRVHVTPDIAHNAQPPHRHSPAVHVSFRRTCQPAK